MMMMMMNLSIKNRKLQNIHNKLLTSFENSIVIKWPLCQCR